ncbi:hypothetical protein TEA_000292 [Camellia sinensis var. sinensis]|uniref:F-box domain-containing protein n=1 Tax=Camellia sinensis var. sinensis TaxID=542762 RepID=A0A4S4EXA1_CAMSN|nr:hypothetical protein TEA_000292 [Camellia sinensis var. sinensis]
MPDDILSFILSFLSIRDSVKARIVSGRWRHICPFMLNRDFDLHTVLGINHKARYSKSNFVTGVDQFLETYKLDSLRICFCLGNEYAGNVDSGICDGDIVIGKRWGGGGARISQRRLWELGIAMVAVIVTLHQSYCEFRKETFLLIESKAAVLCICANLSICKLNLTLDMAILGILRPHWPSLVNLFHVVTDSIVLCVLFAYAFVLSFGTSCKHSFNLFVGQRTLRCSSQQLLEEHQNAQECSNALN